MILLLLINYLEDFPLQPIHKIQECWTIIRVLFIIRKNDGIIAVAFRQIAKVKKKK